MRPVRIAWIFRWDPGPYRPLAQLCRFSDGPPSEHPPNPDGAHRDLVPLFLAASFSVVRGGAGMAPGHLRCLCGWC